MIIPSHADLNLAISTALCTCRHNSCIHHEIFQQPIVVEPCFDLLSIMVVIIKYLHRIRIYLQQNECADCYHLRHVEGSDSNSNSNIGCQPSLFRPGCKTNMVPQINQNHTWIYFLAIFNATEIFSRLRSGT